jgi:hypothetical protein
MLFGESPIKFSFAIIKKVFNLLKKTVNFVNIHLKSGANLGETSM